MALIYVSLDQDHPLILEPAFHNKLTDHQMQHFVTNGYSFEHYFLTTKCIRLRNDMVEPVGTAGRGDLATVGLCFD